MDLSRRTVGGLSVLEAGASFAADGGRPILFLHGIGSSGDAFTSQLAHFGERRWCLAPDAPGYARSTDDHDIASLDDFVDHYLALMDGVGASQADVVGVSWGGVMATRLAAGHADRVHRLVLVDTSRGSGITPKQAAAMRERASTFEAEGVEQFSRARTPRLLSPSAPAELFDAVATIMIEAIRLPGYRQAVESMALTDNSKSLAAITAPTLVIVGSEDAVCPPSEAKMLVDLVPGAILRTIDNAGHLTNQEQPDVFNGIVGAFLEE